MAEELIEKTVSKGDVNNKQLARARCNFHKALVNRLDEIGICPSANIVEDVKRFFLSEYFKVETSRALSIDELATGPEVMEVFLDKESLLKVLSEKHPAKYKQMKDLERCSNGQIKKMQALKYSLNLTWPALKTYIAKGLEREVWLWDLTRNEAYLTIQRLEKWERKNSESGR